MKKWIFCYCLLLFSTIGFAQRTTDKLDRGLVAVKTTTGVYLSWRIFGEEYYDVAYNVYRDGTKLNSTPLLVSNYQDAGGTLTNTYTVSPVVRGVEQAQCAAVSVWNKQYLSVPLQKIYSRRGTDITSDYTANDVSLGDLDGDGVSELIVKRLNSSDANDLFPVNNDSAYVQLEAYKIDGTKLWSVDCGPNMVSSGSVEINIVAYDWDEDGKDEVVLRGADGTIIHYNGGDRLVGSATVNTRGSISHTANMTYTNTGNEYLIYMNGETGEPYQVLTYPLTRGTADDWGDGYGHRCSKYFFGAPFLDGRKPSIFLARGIYTKHKMIAYDVDATTHTLKQRWTWTSDGKDGTWYGQGYHNYGIADVDWDGRDEIVYGSMVIDDNGKGLSTTGLGHGDAQHCSDLDPYRHGQEIFACNENAQGSNYRDATTSKVYYFHSLGRDCGRAMAGNFYDQFPGAQCIAVGTGLISAVTSKNAQDSWAGITQNFRLYWDGDLCEESLDGDATEGNACIYKGGNGSAIFTTSGTKLCNWTKNTPSGQGDILGDWREEIIIRSTNNQELRIYTTVNYTAYRNYTLWHDHQYRQGMVWEMCGYNQPPHTSYFLGKYENITIAPPPLTMTDRTEVANEGSINASLNDKHVIVCETNNMSVAVDDNAAPYILTVNTPTWVQGNDNNNKIVTTTYTHTLTGGAFTGGMRLIKQGDGILTLPAVTETYTGETNIWAGTLNFDGVMESSPVWLNRFAELNSKGTFKAGITMDYDSKLRPAGADAAGTLTVDSLKMNFGSRLIIDCYSEGIASDLIKADYLKIEKKTWANGPTYSTPVIEVVPHYATGATTLAAGKYAMMEVDTIVGSIDDFVLEGLSGQKCYLAREANMLYLVVEGLRDATSIEWAGSVDTEWNFAATANFTDAQTGEAQIFVSGDKVTFNDNASAYAVKITGELQPDTVLVNNTSAYSFSGTGFFSGNTKLVKQGTGALTISNKNTHTGGTLISGGTVKVSTLSNQYQEYGNLGGITSSATLFTIENGATLQTTADVEMGSPIRMTTTEGGVIQNSGAFLMDKAFSGTLLTKKGTGTLTLNATCSLTKMIIAAGTVQQGENVRPAATVELQGGTLRDADGSGSYSSSSFNVIVPEGKTASWYLDSRCDYTNKLTGAGTITVNSPWYRCYISGDWSAFTGTIKATITGDGMWSLNSSYGLPNATLDLSSNAWIYNGGKTFRIGKVTGTGALATAGPNLSGNNTWSLGNDENWTWDGKVTGTGTMFIKTGTGKITFTAVQDFTGTAKIQQGEVHLNSGATLGTGALTVASGATLSATGTITNSSTVITGSLIVGSSTTAIIGSLNFNEKNVTFNNGSTYYVGLRRCASTVNTGGTSIEGINKLTMNGTVSVTLSSSYTPVEGDSMRIWTSTSFAGTPKFDLPALPDGLAWDTSRASEGLLFIVQGTGISSISADETVTVSVISLGGVEVASFDCLFSEVETLFNQCGCAEGSYILKIASGSRTYIKRIQKR